jgi:hypothetical protein
MSDIVQKLWGFCHTLRHDGIDYGDYIEQITYLLFLKMADERDIEVPKGCSWPTIRDRSGTELTEHLFRRASMSRAVGSGSMVRLTQRQRTLRHPRTSRLQAPAVEG